MEDPNQKNTDFYSTYNYIENPRDNEDQKKSPIKLLADHILKHKIFYLIGSLMAFLTIFKHKNISNYYNYSKAIITSFRQSATTEIIIKNKIPPTKFSFSANSELIKWILLQDPTDLTAQELQFLTHQAFFNSLRWSNKAIHFPTVQEQHQAFLIIQRAYYRAKYHKTYVLNRLINAKIVNDKIRDSSFEQFANFLIDFATNNTNTASEKHIKKNVINIKTNIRDLRNDPNIKSGIPKRGVGIPSNLKSKNSVEIIQPIRRANGRDLIINSQNESFRIKTRMRIPENWGYNNSNDDSSESK